MTESRKREARGELAFNAARHSCAALNRPEQPRPIPYSRKPRAAACTRVRSRNAKFSAPTIVISKKRTVNSNPADSRRRQRRTQNVRVAAKADATRPHTADGVTAKRGRARRGRQRQGGAAQNTAAALRGHSKAAAAKSGNPAHKSAAGFPPPQSAARSDAGSPQALIPAFREAGQRRPSERGIYPPYRVKIPADKAGLVRKLTCRKHIRLNRDFGQTVAP